MNYNTKSLLGRYYSAIYDEHNIIILKIHSISRINIIFKVIVSSIPIDYDIWKVHRSFLANTSIIREISEEEVEFYKIIM